MANKRFSVTLVMPNYTIAAYAARFECENQGVDSFPSTTITFPSAACLQQFMAELKKMGEACPGFTGIHANPNRLIRLS